MAWNVRNCKIKGRRKQGNPEKAGDHSKAGLKDFSSQALTVVAFYGKLIVGDTWMETTPPCPVMPTSRRGDPSVKSGIPAPPLSSWISVFLLTLQLCFYVFMFAEVVELE